MAPFMRVSRKFHTLVLLGLLSLLPETVLAQCYGPCPKPSPPSAPSVTPAYSTNGSFQLSVYNPLGSYGYVKWSTGENSSPGSNVTLYVTGKTTGVYSYGAKVCYVQDNVCSDWSSSTSVYVVRAPNAPVGGIITADACASLLSVDWSPGAGYPAGATIYYDLQESVNGDTWTTQLSDSTSIVWSRLASEQSNYQYRIRSRYKWNGYYSAYSGWTSTINFIMPECAGNASIPQPVERASDPVGSIEGAFNVLPSGAASYNIPIETPPGIGGMAPKLSLNYNSQSSNGFMGIGWSVGGLSAISRCPATKEPDSISDGVDFDGNDRFCLDGQKLMLVPGTGSYGAANSEYRTEIDGFSKIIAVSSAGNGPASFIVRARTGEEMLYGSRGDSRIEAQGRTEALIWALNTITDSTGNKMEFYYTEVSSNSEYVPARVEYAFANGISRARVEFTYGTQSSQKMFLAGSVVRNTRLLQTITTYSVGQAVKEYRLDYETAPGSGYKRLTALTECSRVSGTVCMEPTTFAWQGGRSAPTETNMGTRPSSHNVSFLGMHWPVDVDGNGDQELVYSRLNSMDLHYVGSSIEESDGNAQWSGANTSGGNSKSQWVMDVNGDGLNDMVYYQTPTFWVLLNKGDGTTRSPTKWSELAHYAYSVWPLDINNDGRMDLVYNDYYTVTTSSGTYAFETRDYYGLIAQDGATAQKVSLGTGGNHVVGMGNTHWVMDINGDGRSDLVYVQSGTRNYHAMINNGNNTFSPKSWTSRTYDAAYNYAHWPMDVNGDGLTDLVYCNAAWKEEYRVLINKGNGTAEDQRLAVRPQATLARNGQHWISDTNADGVMDLLYKPNNQNVWVLESRADGSRDAVSWGNLSSNDSDDPAYRDHIIELDASGDGLPDLVNASRTSTTYRMLRNNSRPDLMTSIQDGYGNTTTVQYKPLTDNLVYDRTENPYGQYPNVTIQAPLSVVSKVTVPDGVGGARSTNYFYRKLKINGVGRGVLGFEEIDSTDTRSGIRVETKYNQTVFKVGLVSASTRCLDTGGVCQGNKILQQTVNTYATVTTVDGSGLMDAKFVYPSQTVETMYALDNATNTTSALAKITTTNASPDEYGNIQSVTVDTQSLVNTQRYKTKTQSIYENRTGGGKWHLGLLTSSTVTKYLDGGTAADSNSVRKTAFEYDSATGLLTREITEPDRAEPFKRVTAYQRDSYGNITLATACATDFNNCSPGAIGPANLPFRTVTTVYDSNGQFPQTVINAEDESESYVYEPRFGQRLSLTGPNSLTTNWFYDGFGKALKETRADTALTLTAYKWCNENCPPNSRYFVITESTGGTFIAEYFDGLGRKVRVRTLGFDGRNIHTDTEYNNLGQIKRVSEPYFEGDSIYWTLSGYDAIDRITTLTPPLSPPVITEYNGLTTTMSRTVNGVLRVESETKNIIGQTESVTNAAGTTLLYSYDSQGNLTTTETSGRPDTRISVSYDLLGRKTVMNDPDMGRWTYQYNGYGELIAQANALNQTVTMEYDRLGRMVKRTEPEGISRWKYGNTSTYTSANRNIGKLVEVSGPENPNITDPNDRFYVKKIDYDALGRPVQTTTRINIAPYIEQSYATGQEYDGAGRVSSVKYPAVNGVRFQVNNHYNSLGYLKRVISPDGSKVYWQAQEMNARGQLEMALLGNGASVQNVYRPETGWLDGIMVDASDLIYHMSYATDEIGNIQSRTDYRQNLTEHFEYDILDQITRSSITGGTASYTVKNYQYDALGNITFKTGVGAYTYGGCNAGPHAVCQTGSTSDYVYNANGSMTSGNGRSVSYTSFNLPYQFQQGSNSITFHYGTDRTRVFKTDGIRYTAYIGMSDTGNALYEQEVQGSTQKHLHFIYAGRQALAVHTVQTGGAVQAKTQYLHRDHLGSVEAISDEEGNAVAYFSYDAWGNPRNANWTDGGGTNNAPGNLGFTGHEMIPEVGLVHMNGRVYDPVLGKFLSADPMIQFAKDVRSYNRYGYVQNNPLKFTDPTGFLRERVEKWFKKHFGTILNVVSIFYPPLRPFAMAYNMMYAAYYGASVGQMAAVGLVSFVGGMFGNYVAGVNATTTQMLFHQAVISGAVAGGLSGGVNAMIMGTKISRGILQGMAVGAATAAVVWNVSQSPRDAVVGDEIVTGHVDDPKNIQLVTPEFYDEKGAPLSVHMSLDEALQAGEDAAQAARLASGTNNEYGVATIEGYITVDGIQTYYNSAPVTSNHPLAIRWNITGLDNLVAINHYHPNDHGFSSADKKAYRNMRDTRDGFRGIYMFDGRGNHWYGPRRPTWWIFGTRTHSCGGAGASSWSCSTMGSDWSR
jgi:RHS repeat-associated protein